MLSKKSKLDPEVKKWLAVRKAAGRRINPAKAEVIWWHRLVLDPYSVLPDLPPEYQCIGREYFARNPRSEIWVSFNDMPDKICEQIWKRIKPQRDNKREVFDSDELPF